MTAKSYIVNLLNKFEVALTWDGRSLLIPSLLPTEAMMRSGVPGMDLRVKIAVRTRGWGFRSRRQAHADQQADAAAAAAAASANRSRSVPARALLKDKLRSVRTTRRDQDVVGEGGGDHRGRKKSGNIVEISRPTIPIEAAKEDPPSAAAASSASSGYEMGKRSESEHVIHRLLLMSYFPSGFWEAIQWKNV